MAAPPDLDSGPLDERPELDELAEHVSVDVNWYQLGIALKLKGRDLDVIERENQRVADKLSHMFQLWLEQKPKATRRDVLEALRKSNVKEYTIAEKYKKWIEQQPSQSTCSIESKEPSRKYTKQTRTREYGFAQQLHHPFKPQHTSEGNDKRSMRSHGPKKEYGAREVNNPAYQIIDRYLDEIIEVIRKDERICDRLLEQLHFLIHSNEKEVIQKLPFPIKSKAIIVRVSTIISRRRIYTSAFEKFLSVLQKFKEMTQIVEKMKRDAHSCGIQLSEVKGDHTTKASVNSSTSGECDEAKFPSTHTQLPQTPIEMYSCHLKGLYKKWKPDPKWSPEGSKAYVDLAVLDNSQFPTDPFSKSTIHDTVDDIIQAKRLISFQELCNIPYGATVLIEGAPGIGKSMLAYEMCIQWANGDILKNYTLLLLLRLRDESIQRIATVEESVGYFLKGQSWKEDAVRDIIDSSGKGIIVILEGFDELPEDLTKSDSLFLRLVKELPLASFVFTSRPSVKHLLKEELDSSRHVEVLGFTKESINEFTENFFAGNHEQLVMFRQSLAQSPKLASALYIPINLVIVCDSFRQYKEPLPIQGVVTSTKIYEMLIKMLLYRYMKSLSPPTAQVNVSDMNDLPQPVLSQFLLVCKMAYDGIINKTSRLTFLMSEDFETLGLMQKETLVFSGHGERVAYSFLHLTMQEFLAAFHVSRMSHAQIQYHFDKFKDNYKLSNMIRFLSGLTELKSYKLKVQERLYSLNVFQYFSESGNEDLMKETFSNPSSTYSISRILPMATLQDMFSLGRCIALSKCQWELSFTLRGMLPEHVEMLQKGLASELPSQMSCQISEIRLTLNPIGNEGIKHLLQFPDHILKHLHSLRLQSAELNHLRCTEVDLLVAKLPNLTKLLLHNNRFKEGEQLPLINAMASTKIEGVTFSKLSPEECIALLTKVRSIRTPGLYQISSSAIEAVVQCIPGSPSLQELHIEQSLCTPANLSQLPRALASTPHINTLKLVNCAINSSCVRIIADAMLQARQLEILNLNDNYIDDEGGQYLCDMLKHHKCKLKELEIRHNPFTERGISWFLQVLSGFKHGQIFTLSLSLRWEKYVTTQHRHYTAAQKYLNFRLHED